MKNKYIVTREFNIKESKVLVLDKPRDIVDFDTSTFEVDGIQYKFLLTHNEEWIIVNSKETFTGKELIFV